MNNILILSAIFILVSGLSEGFNQAYLFHFAKVQAKFPSLKPNDEAWRNKYKADLKTPKFFGSTTFLVWATDVYHLTRMVTRVLFAIAFTLVGMSGFTGVKLIGLAAIIYLIWTGGFHLVYSLIFK